MKKGCARQRVSGDAMNRISILLVPLVILAAGLDAEAASSANKPSSAPVLVELFTSEGCSSCPPADALIEQIDRTQPIPGADVIALSEHVDYWDHGGWVDPYSSHLLTDRQSDYALRLHLESPYTPQVVVDGVDQVLGSDPGAVGQAIEKARAGQTIPVQISAVSWQSSNTLSAHIEVGPLPEASKVKRADVFLAAALDRAESQVAAGENRGRHLSYVAVVIDLSHVGSVERGKGFAQDVRLKLDPHRDLRNLRVVAFVQESGPGPVLGAAQEHLKK